MYPQAAPHSPCGSAGWQGGRGVCSALAASCPIVCCLTQPLCLWGKGVSCLFALYMSFIASWPLYFRAKGFLVHLPSNVMSFPPGCAPKLHRLIPPLCLCRVAVGGPLIPEGRQPPAFRVTTLPAGDSVTWQFTCRVGACARMTVQPYLDLPARAAVIPGEFGGKVTGQSTVQSYLALPVHAAVNLSNFWQSLTETTTLQLSSLVQWQPSCSPSWQRPQNPSASNAWGSYPYATKQQRYATYHLLLWDLLQAHDWQLDSCGTQAAHISGAS